MRANNEEELSWDCPSRGPRFTHSSSVIEVPPPTDLKPAEHRVS